jgi:2-polyprenyl-6-methoxyphenol hydroxylase-like FAD-dependent oxidoreductase
VVHPLAGQGVNLGLSDARVLAGLLHDLPGHDDPGDASVLRSFERKRAEDILAMRWVTDGLHWLFGVKHPVAARLRNAGLNLTNSIPVIKTLLARRAIGAGDTIKDIS